MTTVKGIRGAVQVDRDELFSVTAEVTNLVSTVLRCNDLAATNVISAFFTATPDLVSCFPARAMRELGMPDVPALGAQELAVDGSLPRVVRLLMHAETPLSRAEIQHIYLGGAAVLRPDRVSPGLPWSVERSPDSGPAGPPTRQRSSPSQTSRGEGRRTGE